MKFNLNHASRLTGYMNALPLKDDNLLLNNHLLLYGTGGLSFQTPSMTRLPKFDAIVEGFALCIFFSIK